MRRPDVRAFADRVWYADRPDAVAVRLLLAPAWAAYAAVVRARTTLYDGHMLASHRLAIPAISVGNLTVGGTGKTPVAGWIAGELQRRGARPAIVLRGYGDDEPAVHARLNPGAVVIADPDRVRGVARAAGEGATVAVLDDAFQHRRARRDADVVLVSADRWPARVRLLPAGPFREPLSALTRASVVAITRKAASPERVAEVERAIRAAAPDTAVATLHLAPGHLIDVRSGDARDLGAVRGHDVLAICGIGDPAAFAGQLRRAGARVRLRAFADHHPYSDADVAALVAEARATVDGGGSAVCTLKDAVKLASRWPADGPGLSFISQQVILETGRDALDRVIDSVLRAREAAAPAAG